MSAIPRFSRLFGSLPDGHDMDLDELFELDLALLLDGIEALTARHR